MKLVEKIFSISFLLAAILLTASGFVTDGEARSSRKQVTNIVSIHKFQPVTTNSKTGAGNYRSPVVDLSTAQQVRACLDIARALAKNTALKLICIDKVEHLDATVREEFLKQVQADEDFQYFLTQVTDGELKIETK